MRSSIRILGVLIVILLIIVIAERGILNQSKVRKIKTLIQKTPTPKSSLSPAPTAEEKIGQDFFSQSNSPTPTFFQNNNSNFQNTDASGFIYPGSTAGNKNGNRLILESSDNPKTITEWYKNKIEALGMKATSFVQTNTNNNVLNKLVASNGEQEISIEIKKESSSLTTGISVNIVNL